MTQKIPLLDLSPEVEALWDELNRAIQDVLRSTRFILGANVSAFEEEMKAYLGVKHAVGLNSGTDALIIGLRAMGVGPGAEVITTPFTFFATAEAISRVGATPVFVDIDPDTLNLNPERVRDKITAQTQAILPVHLFGHAADMDPLLELARGHGLKVLEDVAQAFGGEYKGRKLGTMGGAGAFSFFPTKNLGAYGDAGLLATDDEGIAETARMLRVHGGKERYINEAIGYNSRLDELQAAILRVKLPYLDEWNAKRREVAAAYAELLGEVPGVRTPVEKDYATHVYHQYTVRITGADRDRVHSALEEAGISAMTYYPVPMHKLAVYADQECHCPQAERAASEVLSLPIWPQISRETQRTVAEQLKRAMVRSLSHQHPERGMRRE